MTQAMSNRWLGALLAIGLLALPLHAEQPTDEKAKASQTYVVLVGISNYADKQIKPRPHAEDDAKALAELFANKKYLGVDKDHSRLLLGEDISVAESYLHAVDLATGRITPLTPPRGRGSLPTVSYRGGRWAADGRSVYTASDRNSEFLRLVRLDTATGSETVLSGDLPWDVESFAVSSDGALLAWFANEEGTSRLHGPAAPTPCTCPNCSGSRSLTGAASTLAGSRTSSSGCAARTFRWSRAWSQLLAAALSSCPSSRSARLKALSCDSLAPSSTCAGSSAGMARCC